MQGERLKTCLTVLSLTLLFSLSQGLILSLMCGVLLVFLLYFVIFQHKIMNEVSEADYSKCDITSNFKFNLFNSIKSITSLRDLLDIELVVVHCIRHLCIKIQFTK